MDPFKFDQLPDLCLRKIFALLSLRDLIKCRVVNRLFKVYVDQTKVTELAVIDGPIPCGEPYSTMTCKHWYLTDRRIDFENSISLNAFASMKSSPLQFDQLKYLHIHVTGAASLHLDVLNGLTQLVHLEVKLSDYETANDPPRTLVLPNLKVLNVRAYKHAAYVLKTPKLEVLACEELERIEVEHPEAIKRLACDYRGDVERLKKFKNLQVLDCRLIGSDLNRVRLSDWKQLKELNVSLALECYDDENYVELRSSLVAIIRQRAASKRDDLKLYVEDVLLLDAKPLPLDYETMNARDAFWFTNYRLLRRDTYPEKNSVHFDYLMELDVELSEDFFRRFPAIEYLSAAGPVDRNDFEWFLKKATAVRDLTLENTLLDAKFMERLPKLSSRLTNLEVLESSGLVTDFSFILQFEQLEVFKTDRQLGSLDLAAKAFRKLNELTIFEFRARNECVVISRFSRIKNDYQLRFLELLDNKPCRQVFQQRNLRWTELVALFEQRRAVAPVARKGKARIRRTESD